MSITDVTASAEALQRVVDIVTVALRNSDHTATVDVVQEPRTHVGDPTTPGAAVIGLVVDGGVSVSISLNVTP